MRKKGAREVARARSCLSTTGEQANEEEGERTLVVGDNLYSSGSLNTDARRKREHASARSTRDNERFLCGVLQKMGVCDGSSRRIDSSKRTRRKSRWFPNQYL
jgi:hypothetical protein